MIPPAILPRLFILQKKDRRPSRLRIIYAWRNMTEKSAVKLLGAFSMSDRSLSQLEEFYLSLSDGTRLRLLSLMRDGEVSVGYLSDELQQSQPKISRHLAYLRLAGLVETRRDGKWIYYHISRPANHFASRSLDDALDWVGNLTGRPSAGKATSEPTVFSDLDIEIADENMDEESYSNEIEVYLL